MAFVDIQISTEAEYGNSHFSANSNSRVLQPLLQKCHNFSDATTSKPSCFSIYCTQGLLREIKAEFWPSGNTVKRYQRFDVVLGIYYRKKCGHVEQTQNKSVPVPLHSPVLSSADFTSRCQRLYLEENSNTMCWIFGWQSFIDNRYEQKALQRPGRINCVMCTKEENKLRSKETNS